MSLYSTANKAVFSGNGATIVWPFAFPVLDAAHLAVVRTDAQGVETVLASSLYTVSGIGNPAGGSVTYPLAGAPLPATDRLTLLRTVPYVQGTVLSNQGGYYPEVVEASLDLIYMALQQHEEKLDRAVVAAASDDPASFALPTAAARAGKVPAFDDDGNLTLSTLSLEQIEEQTAAAEAAAAAASAATAASQAANASASASSAATQASAAASSANAAAASAAAATRSGPPQGRLTLTSGVPVMTANVAGAGTIHYTPYCGNQVPLWDGSAFQNTAFAELSNVLADDVVGKAGPAPAASNSLYDLFIWNDGGTVRCTRGPAWASDTSRGTGGGTTELERWNGLLVNKHTITPGPTARYGSYVGTFRTNGSAGIDWNFGGVGSGGVAAMLSVWNAYNRVSVGGIIADTTDGWTYTGTAVRSANASNALRVSVVVGQAEDVLSARYNSIVYNASGPSNFNVGIGYDATNAFSGIYPNLAMQPTFASLGYGEHKVTPAAGFHFMQGCEQSTNVGNPTFSGDQGGFGVSGLSYQWEF